MNRFNFAFMFGALVIVLFVTVASFAAGEINRYVFLGIIVFFAFAAAYAGYLYVTML